MDQPRILIVDDEPSVLAMLEKQLARQLWIITTACNGREALDILRQKKIDLAVVDLQMPEMDGLTLLQKVEDEKIPVQIVILTGRGFTPMAVAAMKGGAVDYMEKPIVDWQLP